MTKSELVNWFENQEEVRDVDIQVFYLPAGLYAPGERTEVLTRVTLRDGTPWCDLTRKLGEDSRASLAKMSITFGFIKANFSRYVK